MPKLTNSTKRKKLPSIKTLKNKAWTLMSNYIRQHYADAAGYVSCVTCGITKPYKEMHAGHFIHASKGSLVSYDDRNIHPQCPKCNTYQGGNLIEYTLFIQKKYGPKTISELKQLKQTIMKRLDFDVVIERLSKGE
ncbi:MAG: recombination protein NinG [Anaerolineales bacterium]|nr:recombination protein NinG [Anaerolineales bacterium]MCK5603551.1 recombination protein NinG [Candidatus Pacearchaeota archaeon]